MKKIILIVVGICFALLLTQLIVSESDSSFSTSSYDKQKTELTNQLNSPVHEGKFYISTNTFTGKVKFIGSDSSNAMVHPSSFDASSATSEDSARQFLSDYGSYLGIRSENDKLSLISSKNLGDGRAVVKMQQKYENVPVFGGEVVVQMNSKKNIISVGSKIMPDLNVDTDYTIDADKASENALNAVAKYYDAEVSLLQTTTPELWIYDPRVFGENNMFVKNPVLVWRMDVFNGDLYNPINELTLVDANNGKIVLHFTQIYTSKYRKIYDNANNASKLIPSNIADLKISEGGAQTAIDDVNKAYNYSGDVYDFYNTYFGRDSINNSGMNITVTVRDANTPSNAYWTDDDQQMVFGNGMVTEDIMGHELTHGVTSYESDLFYYMQSGAINEGLSDIFGEFIELTYNPGPASDRWLMGEDSSLGSIRNMKNPPANSDPDSMNSSYYQCTTGDDAGDYGGVHTNNGVANKAAYLMTDGANFSGYNVTGIGINKTAQLFYEAQTNILTSASDYSDLYDALIQAAINLDFNSSEKLTVQNAINATQMNKAVVCAMTEAPVCDIGVAYNLFFDNLENITSGYWTTVLSSGTYGFYYPQNPNDYNTDSTYATSGQYNIWGDNPSSATESYIKMSLNVSLQAGTEPFLYFKHAYQFEENAILSSCYDGGVIEYSTNGGTTWTDAGSLIINNNYTGTIFDGFFNPLTDRSAFCGTSHGYTSSRLNLTSLAGQNVRFRFGIGADLTGGDYGWYIDDIRIYTCLNDTTAPVVHLVFPRNNSYSRVINVSHSFNVTDDSGPANCTMSWSDFSPSNSATFTDVPVDGSTQAAGTLNSSDGQVTWTVNCTDSAGNTGLGEIWNYTIDTIYPSINFSNPTETSGLTNSTRNYVVVNVTTNDTNFNRTKIYLYNSTGGWIQSAEELISQNLNHNFTNLSDGKYYFNATVSDLAGNTNHTETRNFTIHINPPAITIISPVNNSYYNHTIAFNASLNENSTCRYSVDGAANLTMSSIDNITFNATNSSISQGTHNVTFSCNDTFNNWNFTSAMFTFDIAAPVLSSVTPDPSSTSADIDYTSNESVNATVKYGTSKTLTSSSSTTSFSASSSVSLSSLSASTLYYYNITICDRAANCATNGTYNFTTDAASSGDSSSPGGGSSTTTATGTEYSPTSIDLALGYTQQLKKGERIKFTFLSDESGTHRLTLDDLSSDRAYVTITSDPISLILIPKKEKKLNITSSTYYQLSIKLNSIANNKANITIKEINESIGPSTALNNHQGNQTAASNNTAGNNSGLINGGITSINNIFSNKYVQYGGGVILLILIIVGVIYYLKKRGYKKKWGRAD